MARRMSRRCGVISRNNTAWDRKRGRQRGSSDGRFHMERDRYLCLSGVRPAVRYERLRLVRMPAPITAVPAMAVATMAALEVSPVAASLPAVLVPTVAAATVWVVFVPSGLESSGLVSSGGAMTALLATASSWGSRLQRRPCRWFGLPRRRRRHRALPCCDSQ